MNPIYSSFWICLMAVVFSCAGAPKIKDYRSQPMELLTDLCAPGEKIKKITGRVWLRAKSEKANGRFPADVVVTPQTLSMEVTNLLGASVAFIKVENNQYRVEEAGDKKRVYKGEESWGGIPLLWANDLFAGKVPCPKLASLKAEQLSFEEDLSLKVTTLDKQSGTQQSFIYSYEDFWGRPWAKKLIWTRTGKGISSTEVNFEFHKPESETRSPLRWEAVSKKGTVKVLWKDRKVDKS